MRGAEGAGIRPARSPAPDSCFPLHLFYDGLLRRPDHLCIPDLIKDPALLAYCILKHRLPFKPALLKNPLRRQVKLEDPGIDPDNIQFPETILTDQVHRPCGYSHVPVWLADEITELGRFAVYVILLVQSNVADILAFIFDGKYLERILADERVNELLGVSNRIGVRKGVAQVDGNLFVVGHFGHAVFVGAPEITESDNSVCEPDLLACHYNAM